VHAGDLALKAPRPKFCALSNEKLRGVGIDMPTWQDALERYLHLRAEGPRAASG
jgi:dTDP-4-dehydrorhamnose reductase